MSQASRSTAGKFSRVRRLETVFQFSGTERWGKCLRIWKFLLMSEGYVGIECFEE